MPFSLQIRSSLLTRNGPASWRTIRKRNCSTLSNNNSNSKGLSGSASSPWAFCKRVQRLQKALRFTSSEAILLASQPSLDNPLERVRCGLRTTDPYQSNLAGRRLTSALFYTLYFNLAPSNFGKSSSESYLSTYSINSHHLLVLHSARVRRSSAKTLHAQIRDYE